MASVKKRPLYHAVSGIPYPAMFSERCMKEAMLYNPQPDDVFICTYPKCGTTWMQNIALYIFRKGREVANHDDFLTFCPFIDFTGRESIDKMPRPGAFKTHLTYTHMPKSNSAKYIFVLRDPKDCCVSFYHHTQSQVGFAFWDGHFDDFFELFMAGEVEYGDYFDHLDSWWPNRDDRNLFHTFYETMRRDTKGVVLDLAKFLGDEFIEAIHKDNSVLRNILHFSSFEYMKANFRAYNNRVYKNPEVMNKLLQDPNVFEGVKYAIRFISQLDVPEPLPKQEFVRKGIVGDWKNQFTAEQTERLNKKFLDRTRGMEVRDWYSIL